MRLSAMRRPLVSTGCGLAMVLASGAPAHAAGATVLSGVMQPDQGGVCTGDPGSLGGMVVSGTLVGCWYLDTYEPGPTNPAGGTTASGTETFIGCLGDACGRLFTTFTFTGKYDGATEEHGRCHHPIVGGDGDFAGATGVINMHDEPNGCIDYKGTISF